MDKASEIFLTIFIGCLLIIIVVVSLFMNSVTNTPQQINIMFYTDNLTGCKYLLSEKGGILPRMSADGTQLCDKEVIHNLPNRNLNPEVRM